VLCVEGRATIDGREVVQQAVPAEDRMQAFLWRHLVPAQSLEALVFDPSVEPLARRARRLAAAPAVSPKAPAAPVDGKPKFTQKQVVGRLRQIAILFDEGLITEDFERRKIQECEALR
jgi:hypothetical protein